MATKHEACKAHVKLDCSCKVCVVPGVNGTNAGKLLGATELAKFHMFIHRTAAKRHALELKRPAGDGKIEGAIGGRLTPKQVIAFWRSTSKNRGNLTGPYELGQNLAANPQAKGFRPHEIPKAKFTGTHRKGQPRLGARMRRVA